MIGEVPIDAGDVIAIRDDGFFSQDLATSIRIAMQMQVHLPKRSPAQQHPKKCQQINL
jgi:hypothetical protein